jgi:TonB family protein
VALLGAVAVAVFGGTRFAARNAETLVSAPVGAAATGVAAAAETVLPPGDARGVAAHGPATTIPESAATPALARSGVAPEPAASGLVDAGSADAGYVAQASLTRPTPTPASFARFFQVARPVPVRAPGVVAPEFVEPEFVAPEFVEPGVVLPPQSTGAAGSPTERDAIVGDSVTLAPAAEPARVAAAVRTTPMQPLAAPATPPSDAAESGAETPLVPFAADTADAPASAATPAAPRGLPATADDLEQDESTGTAVAAAATFEAGATDSPAAADATAPAPGVAEDQPAPVRGAFTSSPAGLARPAPAPAPAASTDAAAGQAAASVDRPAGATIAAAGPSASSPPAESDAPDAPSSALASAGDSPAGTFPSAPSPPEQSRLGEITGGELKRSPNPGYPRRARLNGVEGQVTVRYEVDLRGRVDGLEVLSADPGETFVAAVRKAVRRWRHEPFLADGEPVGARVTRTFEFAIRKEPMAAGEKPGAGCRRVTGSRLCRSKDAYQELGIVVVHNPL